MARARLALSTPAKRKSLVRLTMFASKLDRAASTHEASWPELVARIMDPPTYATKEACPLLKLAVYGNVPSAKGHLRHDANVLCVTGIEIDHDSKPGQISMSPEEAAERMRAANVLCIIATTASYTHEKPRWRLFAPLSVEYPPEYRRAFLTYVDGLLDGAAAGESYALSQAYFVGRVEGVEYRAIPVDGQYVDMLTEPVAIPLADATAANVPDWHHVDLDGLNLPDDAKALIREGASQGERSEALMSAANMLARARVHPDDIVRILSDPAYKISAKSLDGRRQKAAMDWLAKHTVRKALEAFPPLDIITGPPPMFGEVRERRRLLVSVDEMLARPRVPNWLVTGILEKHTLGMLFGDPGVGKSFVALGWALSIASGVPWQGREVAHGPVVYVAGEGFGGLSRRADAWRRHAQVSRSGVPIHFTERAVAFNDPTAIGELQGEIDALSAPPVLIVVDTLSRATPGLDLDKAKDMNSFVGACDRLRDKYQCAVLVVHHSGHGDKNRAMNSIALKGAVDFEAGVKREGDDTLRLASTKAKDAEPFDDIVLRFTPVQLDPIGGDPNTPPKLQTSVVLIECDAAVTKKPAPNVILLREVLRGAEQGGMGVDAARKEFVRLHAGTPDTARRGFHRALEQAIASGVIVQDEDTGRLREFFS